MYNMQTFYYISRNSIVLKLELLFFSSEKVSRVIVFMVYSGVEGRVSLPRQVSRHDMHGADVGRVGVAAIASQTPRC